MRLARSKVVHEPANAWGEEQQHAVPIERSDAAWQGREVDPHGAHGPGVLPPPSPAPAKEVAMRVRDALLGGWSLAQAAGQAGGGDGGGGGVVSGGGVGDGGGGGGGSDGDGGSIGTADEGGGGRRSGREFRGGGGGPGCPGPLSYLLSDAELLCMCKLAKERRLWSDSSVVSVRTPVKIFGDLHGQYADLLRYFAAFGSPAVDVECATPCLQPTLHIPLYCPLPTPPAATPP